MVSQLKRMLRRITTVRQLGVQTSMLALICNLSVGCSQITSEKESSVLTGETAQWIQDDQPLPATDSLFYQEHAAPLFRKEFNLERPVEQARLLITAAGYYQATLNGASIGNAILDPAWTDFSKRIYYSEFDVSELIEEGENCLGVALGNGFYNPLPMRKWGRRNLREDLAEVGKPVFIAKLVLDYENGQREEIVSDTDWSFAYGPMLKNSVYLGVVYDANQEVPGWDRVGFDDSTWQPAQIGQPPGGQLEKAFFPPVEIMQEIVPEQIYSPEPGLWIVDMGINFTGSYRINLFGQAGDTVTFRFGERIYEDGNLNPMTAVIGQIKREGVGGPGAPDIAWQMDTYILGDESEQVFQPDFTYHTYRYMEIEGLDEQPDLADVKGLFMHTNVPNTNHFSSSSELLNDIQEATERTFLANLISVQSDCPAREKFGYGGDINATSEAFIYNFDMQDFYRKTIYDWLDAMNDSTFVDTAPFVGIQYCGISWESAFLTTQYYLYLYYNDVEIIRELYQRDVEWMEKAARLHPEGIVEQGLSDHESLEPVPVELTGTAHYLQCARIMQTFASVMGDQQNEKKFEALAQRLKELIRAKFWEQTLTEKINRQTLFSTLLYHDIIPAEDLVRARDSLLTAVQNGPSGHFNTGIFGTKYVLETLSEVLSPDSVFAIVNSTAYPGWGHMIDQGATTIWETWKESDNTFSNCHPMFGTVTEWYYRWLAGIRPLPAYPGFKQFTLAPATPEGLESVDCTYQTAMGPIVSKWEKSADSSYTFEFTIPKESIAQVKLPLQAGQQVSLTGTKQQVEGLESGVFELGAGSYSIVVSNE